MPAPARKAGLATRDPKRPRIRQSRDARRGRPSAADADELGVALCHELGCDADADSRVTKVLADRLTCDAQQALRRCRSHSPSGHQPTPATLFPDGRNGEGLGAARLGSRETPPFRPFHKPGGGCTACPRCWRNRRTAVTRYPIEQTPTSGCICNSTPTTDAHAIPAALPSPARAVLLARANGALSELVHLVMSGCGPPACLLVRERRSRARERRARAARPDRLAKRASRRAAPRVLLRFVLKEPTDSGSQRLGRCPAFVQAAQIGAPVAGEIPRAI